MVQPTLSSPEMTPSRASLGSTGLRPIWEIPSAFDFRFRFSLLVLRSDKHRQTRVGRLSGGVVGWGDRHGCRSSAVAPGMARTTTPERRNPTKSGRTSAQVVSSFCRNKRTRPSGRNLNKPHRECCWRHPIKSAAPVINGGFQERNDFMKKPSFSRKSPATQTTQGLRHFLHWRNKPLHTQAIYLGT